MSVLPLAEIVFECGGQWQLFNGVHIAMLSHDEATQVHQAAHLHVTRDRLQQANGRGRIMNAVAEDGVSREGLSVVYQLRNAGTLQRAQFKRAVLILDVCVHRVAVGA